LTLHAQARRLLNERVMDPDRLIVALVVAELVVLALIWIAERSRAHATAVR